MAACAADRARSVLRSPVRSLLIAILVGLPVAAATFADVISHTFSSPALTAQQMVGSADGAITVTAARRFPATTRAGSPTGRQQPAPQRDPAGVDVAALLPRGSQLAPMPRYQPVQLRIGRQVVRTRILLGDVRQPLQGFLLRLPGGQPGLAGECLLTHSSQGRLHLLDGDRLRAGRCDHRSTAGRPCRWRASRVIPRASPASRSWLVPIRHRQGRRDSLAPRRLCLRRPERGHDALPDVPRRPTSGDSAGRARTQPRRARSRSHHARGAAATCTPHTTRRHARCPWVRRAHQRARPAGGRPARRCGLRGRGAPAGARAGPRGRERRRRSRHPEDRADPGARPEPARGGPGVATGVATAVLGRPLWERLADTEIAGWAFAPREIAAAALAGTLSGLAAAVVPAVFAGRMLTVDALAARFSHGRSARNGRGTTGVVLLVAGVASGLLALAPAGHRTSRRTSARCRRRRSPAATWPRRRRTAR